jgi:DNA-binding LacI/PurR family transcriptional regulator
MGTMSRRLITSLDVARAAGVSQSAVSRAFREGASISPGLRQRVAEAAKRLGYTPNAFARGLNTRETGLIGVVMESLVNPVQSALLDALLAALEGTGWRPLLTGAADHASLVAALAGMEAYRPEGVIVCAPTLPPALGARLHEDRVPVVVLNRYPGRGRRGRPACVRCDNRAGAAALARHLLGLGHRRIAILRGPPGAPAAEDRVDAFRAALAEAGVAPAAEVAGGYAYADGAGAAEALIQGGGPLPSAVFCANDLSALGAMDAARRLGLSVPGDLAVTGFDGIPAAGFAAYGLTTAEQDMPAMAQRAIGLVAARIAAPELPAETVLVPPRLVIRASTAPAA